jgi:imidazole glycerol-phosphate synthase subunit HisF
MLRSRVIPCLLVHDRGLVKTVRFGASKYVGDPINAVRIFNEKEVDELVVLDIDASVRGTEPDYAMIRNLAAECRMPLCYGGGIKTAEQAARIIKMGVEKVSVSSAAVERPQLVAELACRIGNQSVVVVLDLKRNARTGALELWTHNATRHIGLDPVVFARQVADLGAGEITINAIDRDGVMKGYDLEMARSVRETVTVPMTVLGGAGSLADIEVLIRAFGIVGAAAGSLFVFKGVYRAVLINYPRRADKEALLGV